MRRAGRFRARVEMMMRRNNEASERHAERRRREDEAPRLSATVPNLLTLKLHLQESKGDVSVAETGHIRHVVVAHAPLLFELPCRDNACKDGGHDITNAITRSLKAGETQFEGEHSCTGYVGDGPCQRVLRYTATATYK
jgi:hypothetical protein